MKNIFLYSWLYLLFTMSSYSQDLQNANWVFGAQNSLNFPNPFSLPSTSGTVATTFNTEEGCASVSDINGNLLFYTDGVSVFDNNGTQLNVGQLLNGDDSSAQNAIIVPRPGFDRRFYIVTINGFTSNRLGLYYSEINLDQALPQMTAGTLNIPLYFTLSPATPIVNNFLNLSESLTSTVHGNGTDYWVVAHVKSSVNPSQEAILSYRVDTNGFNPTPFASLSLFDPANSVNAGGKCIKISPPNGNSLQHIALSFFTNREIFVGTFDNMTGQVDFEMNLPVGTNGYGVEFSSDGNILYYANGPSIDRFNFQSQIPLPAITRNQKIWGLQRGIDGRIYFVEDQNRVQNVGVITDNGTTTPILSTIVLTSVIQRGLPQWVWINGCRPNLVDDTDIPPGFMPIWRQRTENIRLTNTVQNNSTNITATPTSTIYHAGNYVLMLPQNGSNLGFNAEFGSKFAAYIEGCSDNFVYRNSQSGAIKEQTIIAKSFLISPNPSNSFIDLIIKNDTFNKITMVSIDGKMVFEEPIESTSSYNLDISRYASGVYIVNVISSDGKQYSQKLIKN